MIYVITLVALAMLAAVVYLLVQSYQRASNMSIQGYENSLAWERTRVDHLLTQIQNNSQGLQHVPMLGPFNGPLLPGFTTDETGLVEIPFSDDERDYIPATEL